MRLDRVKEGTKVQIISIGGGKGVRRRLTELGIFPGEYGTVEKNSFGPILLRINGNNIALGRGIAAKIEVKVE
ncbi:MAG: ferrous iron transport protein A [Methanomicrobia archaeon]|nr:ferrous iron transport protein A [Methanomicrobia archaeon]HDM23095.1 ferrous iron transport protein A [Methanomicrobia archaeon]